MLVGCYYRCPVAVEEGGYGISGAGPVAQAAISALVNSQQE